MHCLLCLKHVAATPYDPHVPDHRHTWFEGWYTRIQSDTGLSFAAVTGSFPGDLLPHSTAYAGILYQPHVGHTKAYHAFPSDLVVTGIDGQPVKHQPDQLSEANFALHATDKFVNVSVHGLSLHMSFAAEGALLEVEGYGPLLSWGSKPGDSPEGISIINHMCRKVVQHARCLLYMHVYICSTYGF